MSKNYLTLLSNILYNVTERLLTKHHPFDTIEDNIGRSKFVHLTKKQYCASSMSSAHFPLFHKVLSRLTRSIGGKGDLFVHRHFSNWIPSKFICSASQNALSPKRMDLRFGRSTFQRLYSISLLILKELK